MMKYSEKNIDFIRNSLADEESIRLFDNRVDYYKTRNIIALMKNVQVSFDYTQCEYKD